MASGSNQQEQLNKEISSELGLFVESRSSTFTCGGSIPIAKDIVPQPSNKEQASTKDVPPVETEELSSLPITIRWDSQRSDATHKITLPVVDSNGESQGKLNLLLNDCQPASFGYQGKDVYDENYRKATKLDCSDFSTSFCPYSLGIIDTIAQVLLPNSSSENFRTGVRAELYKLNFYSAPSGFFKAHVDTPRSEAQFGSLVVSLPCHHEGGQLVVRHAGHSVTYDWSTSKAKGETSQCQWAAFYSDCEHEVLELTEGHRLTLTYNLYVVPGVGQLAGNSPALGVSSLPLYQKVKEALDNPAFMPEGGYIGIYCTHAYPHTTGVGKKSLPGILKGADMAVYAVFHALGLQVHVKAVLDENYGNESMYYLNESMCYREGMYYRNESTWWDPDYEPSSASRIGDWGNIQTTDRGGDCGDSWERIIDSFRLGQVEVNWLTGHENKHKSTGFVHLTYGNQAGIDSIYTYAVLLVKVPSAHKRITEKTRAGSQPTPSQFNPSQLHDAFLNYILNPT
ncbi:hypothetical protein F5Y04DRAFT_74033 [Hypomontagnella monticulosa]|nr:hypothetical protein F5Y04DRAFT_74033 [Hypomontagnella monticulosa]